MAAIWIIGAILSYFLVFKKWDDEDATKFEKVWYAAVWPMVGILYLIHLIHNNL